MTRLVRQVAGVADRFRTVGVGEGEAVFLVYQYGIVGVLDLSATRTQDEFSIAGYGKGQSAFVDVLAVSSPANLGVPSLQVCQGPYSRFYGQTAYGQVYEGGKNRETCCSIHQFLIVSKNTVEEDAFTFVSGFAGAFAPKGVVNLDEALSYRCGKCDVEGIHLVDLFDGDLNVAHDVFDLEIDNIVSLMCVSMKKAAPAREAAQTNHDKHTKKEFLSRRSLPYSTIHLQGKCTGEDSALQSLPEFRTPFGGPQALPVEWRSTRWPIRGI